MKTSSTLLRVAGPKVHRSTAGRSPRSDNIGPMGSLLNVLQPADLTVFGLLAVLLLILIIAFASRAYVFCQYLKTMTGIALKPREVRRIFRQRGKEGVRDWFLDLIIREDLKAGPIPIPEKRKSAPNRIVPRP